jgi:hypothetical protein
MDPHGQIELLHLGAPPLVVLHRATVAGRQRHSPYNRLLCLVHGRSYSAMLA